jgi:hypothetical protein
MQNENWEMKAIVIPECFYRGSSITHDYGWIPA